MMPSPTRPLLSRAARWLTGGVLCFGLSAIVLPMLAVASPAPAVRSIDRGWLSGGGPRSVSVPIEAPYTIGWSAPLVAHKFSLQSPSQTGGLAVDPRSGWVYATTSDGRVVAVDQGSERFSVEVGSTLLAAPALLRELLVVASADGVVSVLNKVTGERRTRAILGEELITAPVVADTAAGPRAYVGSTFESLFAVDLATGARLWRVHRDRPSGFTLTGFARPVLFKDLVVAGFADGSVVAIDAVSGAVRWETKVSPKGEQVDVDALVSNGTTIFAASATAGVVALDPATGSIQWRHALPGAARLATDGLRVFACAPGVVEALEASRGAVAFRFTLDPRRISGTPVVVEDTLVLPIVDGLAYFLDRRSGAPLGSFGSGPGFLATPAHVGRVLYLLSNAGRLYALGLAR